MIINYLISEKHNLFANCDVKWVVEPSPLGTGGAIAHAAKKLNLDESFLLINADTWLDSGFSQLMVSSAPSMMVVNVENVSRYGEVVLCKNGSIDAFMEKNGNSNPGWINAGAYLMKPEYFQNWHGAPFSFENITLPFLVDKKLLRAVPSDANFLDIGIPDDYGLFCKWAKLGRFNKFNI